MANMLDFSLYVGLVTIAFLALYFFGRMFFFLRNSSRSHGKVE